MHPDEFEKLVVDALKSLPKEIKKRLKNVDVVIEQGRRGGRTMGLYQGVSLEERIGIDYSMMLPDKITIYQRAVEAECEETGADIRKEVKHLIRHEIAHHFGISDERMEDLGIY